MKNELQQRLLQFVEEIARNETESDTEARFRYKKNAGVLYGHSNYLFGVIIEILLRDDKANYLEKRDLENSLWEFVLDIKANPKRYSNKEDILNEIERFYSEIANEDKKYKILLPLKNIEIYEEISTKDFKLKIFDQKLAKEWGLPTGEKEKVVLLTTIKANSSWKAFRRGKNKCFSILALLQILPRIYKASRISPVGNMFIQELPHNQIRGVRLDEIPQKTFLPMENDIDYLQKWSDLLASHSNEMTKRITAGIKLLAEAHTTPEIAMKLIKIFIALETVFTGGEKGTKKFKLMFRVILFLSRREKGFLFPPIILYLYNRRNDFMHEATEIELPEVEQLELEKHINNIMYTSRDVYLELLKLVSENKFEDHSSFISWLLDEDDIFTDVVNWFEEKGFEYSNGDLKIK